MKSVFGLAIISILLPLQGVSQGDTIEPLDIDGAIIIGENLDATPAAGTIRWNPSTEDFEGFNGSEWISLTRIDNHFGLYNSVENKKLSASDGFDYDDFGVSVSLSGSYAIVGSRRDDDNGGDSGSAYIFRRYGKYWSEMTKLKPDDGALGDRFGQSVAISGIYAIGGAPRDDDNGSNSGSAYIFKRSGVIFITWNEEDKLTASDADANDQFGISTSISGDYAIVGAHNNDDNGSNSGSAYIFHRSGSSWNQQAKLTDPDGAQNDFYGASVAISGDYAIVGSYGDNENGNNSGSAFIYHRSGSNWTQQAKLTPSDGAENDFFGVSVSINGDYAIVGAIGDDDKGSYSGSAYIFKRSGSTWSQEAKLISLDGSQGDQFGVAVSVSNDYTIVGANNDDLEETDAGSVYVFQKSGNSWVQHAKLIASDGSQNAWFGSSVSLSGDYIIIGAYNDDENGPASGSIYFFEKN